MPTPHRRCISVRPVGSALPLLACKLPPCGTATCARGGPSSSPAAAAIAGLRGGPSGPSERTQCGCAEQFGNADGMRFSPGGLLLGMVSTCVSLATRIACEFCRAERAWLYPSPSSLPNLMHFWRSDHLESYSTYLHASRQVRTHSTSCVLDCVPRPAKIGELDPWRKQIAATRYTSVC